MAPSLSKLRSNLKSNEAKKKSHAIQKNAKTYGDDSKAPMNWPKSKKLTMVCLVILADLNDAMGSSIFAPVVHEVSRDFHASSSSVASLLISVHVIGYIAGPLILSPLSEVYGRCPLIHGSNTTFVAATIICTTSVNIPMIIIGRILMGFAGSVPATVGGGVISDIIPVDERGYAGIAVGPIIGGYMAMNLGWRWTFRLMTILSGSSTVLTFLLLRETFVPSNIQPMENRDARTGLSVVRKAVSRPCRLFLRSPIVVILSLFGAIAYVCMYSLMSTYSTIFPDQYGFNLGEVGLVYLGQGIGFWLGQLLTGWFPDWYLKRRQTHQNSVKPEDRLLLLTAGCFGLAIGIFWYGWSIEGQVHWVIPIIGTGFTGIGCLLIFVSVQLYLVDIFPSCSASASAVAIVIRSIFGATLPMSMPSLYERLGFGWGNSVLGSIVLVLMPVSILLLKYGERLRTLTDL